MKTLVKFSFAIAICFALFSCGNVAEKSCTNCDSTMVPCDSNCVDSTKTDSTAVIIDSIQP